MWHGGHGSVVVGTRSGLSAEPRLVGVEDGLWRLKRAGCTGHVLGKRERASRAAATKYRWAEAR